MKPTHQPFTLLALRGLNILNMPHWVFDHELVFLNGVIFPDIVENDGLSFRGHFYDPYTGNNLLGHKSPTAMIRYSEH